MPKFHLLGSDGMTRIDGHKHPQADNPIITYEPDKVYICCLDNKGIPLTEQLKVGDEVKVGTKLGVRSDFGLPVYSSVSGKIIAIEKKTSTVLGRLVDHFVIQNDKKGTKENLLPLKDTSKEGVVNKLKEGSIVGLGGAGFPTFIKYNLRPGQHVDTLLVNAVECEPYLTTDYLEGSRAIEDMFYALPILCKIVSIKEAIIAVKENKPLLIETVKKAIEDHKFTDLKVTLKLVKDRYPMGFERTLIREVLHREYNILPSECGVIENNIQTLEAAGRLFKDGSIISRRVITIAGEGVNKQFNVDVPVGTIVDEIIVNNGGYAAEEIKIVNGGPMCGKALLTCEVPVLLQSGGYTIMKRYDLRAEPCWKCGACVDHCPMGLQPVQIQMALKRNDIERCHDLQVEKCVECGLCSFICPSHIDVSANMSKAKLLARFKFKPGVLSAKDERIKRRNERIEKRKQAKLAKQKPLNETKEVK